MLGPLAVELDAMTQTGTADVWDELPVQRQIELKVWVRAQNTMLAWEQYRAEEDAK